MSKLPPPDPHESFPLPGRDEPLTAPVAFYVNGAPTPQVRRTASAFLDLRPGALIVLHASD